MSKWEPSEEWTIWEYLRQALREMWRRKLCWLKGHDFREAPRHPLRSGFAAILIETLVGREGIEHRQCRCCFGMWQRVKEGYDKPTLRGLREHSLHRSEAVDE